MVPALTAVRRAIPLTSNGAATRAAVAVAVKADVLRPEWLSFAGILLLEEGGRARSLSLEGMVKELRDDERCDSTALEDKETGNRLSVVEFETNPAIFGDCGKGYSTRETVVSEGVWYS